MLSLHTNAAALAAQNSITTTQASLATSQTRLSTGYRINSSQDDAAGLQIATRLKAQTSGMAIAKQNTQNSISMLQTADGALSETTAILTRMKDLATQAADSSSTTDDQKADQSEYDTLSAQLSNIMSNTSFGGSKLFSSLASDAGKLTGSMQFQIGDSKSETMTVDLSAEVNGTPADGSLSVDAAITAASTLYKSDGTADYTTAGTELTGDGTLSGGITSANGKIDDLSNAIKAVGTLRSSLGATENSLQHVYNNLSNVSTNTTDATGRIMDTDFATESSNMTSQQMLLQAGTAMLKQSNSISSLVISLLQ